MQIRRVFGILFGVVSLLLIVAYFYMRIEQFPRDSTHHIWIAAMLCSWISVFAIWRSGKDSQKD